MIDSVKPNMKSYLNEIFGPVLQIIEIDDVEEGIQIINENSFAGGINTIQIIFIIIINNYTVRMIANKYPIIIM